MIVKSEITGDELWVLQSAAAQPAGFVPHSMTVKGACVSLETVGWLRRSELGFSWHITEAGRVVMNAAILQQGADDQG